MSSTAATTYTCPMHPQIRQPGPGDCPICGMALEPLLPTLDEGPDPELVSFKRRFWLTLPLTVVVTVLAMAGLPARASVDGVNLLGLLRNPGGAGPARRGVLLEATAHSRTVDPPWDFRGVVDGSWKYVERTSGRKEVYDLVNDPFELENVAGRAAYSARQKSLAQLLAALRECRGAQCR